MIGEVIVMEPAEYDRWAPAASDGSLASAGRRASSIRLLDVSSRRLRRARTESDGLYGKPVLLDDGRTVIADESYIRESILNPGAKIVSGFKNIMPTFQGQLSEEEVSELVAYVKALGNGTANCRCRSASRTQETIRSLPRPKLGRQERQAARQTKATPASQRQSSRGSNDGNSTQTIEPKTNYLNADYGIKSWLLTTDHKRIALLYLVSITFLLRRRLLRHADPPGTADPGGRPGVVRHLQQAVHHARHRDDLFLPDPVDPGGARQFPGAADDRRQGSGLSQAEPGELVHLHDRRLLHRCTPSSPAASIPAGPSTRRSARRIRTRNVIAAALGVFIVGFSSILTGLNFIVTIHRMRAPGMTWCRLPLFIWAHYATSVIMVLGTPVLAITLVLVALERLFHIGIFDPALGGDPLLFQHLFWFYSHPAVYIMILPGMGVVSEIIACFSRKRDFGYTSSRCPRIAIAVLGFLVWAHHMFVAGMSTVRRHGLLAAELLVAIPSAIKVFNWTATMYKGSIRFDTPMLYAFGFIGLFTMGGLTGLFLASPRHRRACHDTYFVVAHFHYIMVGGAVMAYHGGTPLLVAQDHRHGCIPKRWAKLSALLVFIGFNLTFFPQFLLGYLGMPRRYHAYPPEFQVLNVLSTAGASILAVGYVLPLIYLLWSLRYGKDAGPNPGARRAWSG